MATGWVEDLDQARLETLLSLLGCGMMAAATRGRGNAGSADYSLSRGLGRLLAT